MAGGTITFDPVPKQFFGRVLTGQSSAMDLLKITTTSFPDAYNFNIRQLMKCCTHHALPAGNANRIHNLYGDCRYRPQIKARWRLNGRWRSVVWSVRHLPLSCRFRPSHKLYRQRFLHFLVPCRWPMGKRFCGCRHGTPTDSPAGTRISIAEAMLVIIFQRRLRQRKAPTSVYRHLKIGMRWQRHFQ